MIIDYYVPIEAFFSYLKWAVYVNIYVYVRYIRFCFYIVSEKKVKINFSIYIYKPYGALLTFVFKIKYDV